jgi:hypothetical protein
VNYRISLDAPIERELKRIAVGQIDAALAEIEDRTLDPESVVHQVRKRCKKIRALAKLVRSSFEAYGDANGFFRDAAAGLGSSRDAQSIIEAFDRLKDQFPKRRVPKKLACVREALVLRRERILREQENVSEQLELFASAMREGRCLAENWRLSAGGFDAVRGGLKTYYKRGRKTFRKARKTSATEDIHEWRKYAKAHWYHVRLLQGCERKWIRTRRLQFRKLTRLLGADHDFALLEGVLANEELPGVAARQVRKLLPYVAAARQELQAAAFAKGGRLFGVKPKTLCARVAKAWKADRPEATSEPAGTGAGV